MGSKGIVLNKQGEHAHTFVRRMYPRTRIPTATHVRNCLLKDRGWLGRR